MKKLLIFCVVIGFVFALGNIAMATEWEVPGDFATIQEAIDAAIDGDTIYVHDGTYDESVVVDGKDLSLIAIGVVTVHPTSCTGHNDVIQVYNGDVEIRGFIVDATNCKGGIYVNGGGICGTGPASLIAVNNNVHSYLKNGITVNCPEAYGHIEGNTIQGSGQIGVPYYAQNGIQFGYGGTGEAMRNTVEGNWYTGPDWGATGILVFESGGVVVQGNTVIDCGTGVAVEAWGYYYPSANNNKIVKNTIEGSQYGVSVAAYDWIYSYMDCFADNNKVVNNSIISENGDTGITVGAYTIPDYGFAGDFTSSANNNKVIRNVIDGFATNIDEEGTATKIRANVYE